MSSVALQVPLAGSYNSALVNPLCPALPPTTRTRPSRSRVALWLPRAVESEPVVDHWPVTGSNSSAEARAVNPAWAAVTPPATSTRPSASSRAVCPNRADAIAAAAVH
jgi:hypothetical protein